MDGDKDEICDAERREECVNLLQQGSAVLYNWFLPVIREFKNFEFSND